MAVVVVTGGSSGIGLATVRRLAAAGDRVYSASRDPGRADLPAGVTPVPFDVADPVAAGALVDRIVADDGRVDAVVNNAGTGILAAVEDSPDDEAHRVFEVNFFGPMRLAAAAIPVMRAQGAGRIVNVTSIQDVYPLPLLSWYSASKAALASASLALAAEVHVFGIGVSVVSPGLFLTPMAESIPDMPGSTGSRYAPVIEARANGSLARLERAGDPDDVAAVIESCIHGEVAPARVLVGADAEQVAELVRSSSAEDVAAIRRSFVTSVLGPQR